MTLCTAIEMEDLTYSTIPSKLLERVPELQSKCESELRMGGAESLEASASLEKLLTPFTIDLLESKGDERILRRIFSFLEELAVHDDWRVRAVLKETVLDQLSRRRYLLKKAREHMADSTRRLSDEVEAYYNISDLLVERLPELRDVYESELKHWGDERPGPHVIYGDILNPFLVSVVESDGNEDTLRRAFALLEELAKHEDEKVKNVVHVTVLEHLVGNGAWMRKARKYMGEATRLISEKLQAYWGCAEE